MADAPNFDDQKSFDAWLDSFDDETALAYAQVLYGRAALRVMPLLAGVWDLELYTTIELDVTHSMRANFLSAVARKYSTASNREAARSAGYLAISHRFTVYSAYSAFAAGSSNFAIFSNLSTAGATAFPSSATAFETYVADMWRSVINDAKLLLSEMSVRDLDTAPIWLNGDPPWFRKSRINFDNYLREDGPHWDFWLDWYAAKVAGEPMDRLGIQGEDFIGQKLAEQDQAFWDRGPEAVSADIEAWIAKIPLDVPVQQYGAKFGIIDQKLDLTGKNQGLSPETNTKRVKALLPMVRSALGAFVASTPVNKDGNSSFGLELDAAQIYLEATNEAAELLDYDLLFGLGTTLQNRLHADLNRSLESDLIPLSDSQRLALKNFQTNHGSMITGTEEGAAAIALAEKHDRNVDEARRFNDELNLLVDRLGDFPLIADRAKNLIQLTAKRPLDGHQSERAEQFTDGTFRNAIIVLTAGSILSILTPAGLSFAASVVFSGLAWDTIKKAAPIGAKGEVTARSIQEMSESECEEIRAFIDSGAGTTFKEFLTENDPHLRKVIGSRPEFQWLHDQLDYLKQIDQKK